MSSVRKLPSGKWNATAYYKDPLTGKVSRPSFTAPTKTEAVRMAAEWEAEKERAALPTEMTVGECVDRYITVKTAALSPSTIRGYRNMQHNNFKSIEKMSIKALTDENVQAFVSGLCRSFSPKSVRNIYALFSSSVGMFSTRQFRVTLPQKKQPEYHIPTDEDVRLLMASAAQRLKIAIALGAVGTLREGEVAALKYGDIDRAGCTIHVHADLVKDEHGKWIYKDSPKTSAGNRLIPLPAQVIELLGDGDPDDFVYGGKPTAINQSFKKLRNGLGLKCRFHDLRHYAASIMHALGVPDQYIMERGGWKSDAVLKSVYRNSLSDQSAKFAEVANNHFSGLL